LTPPNTSFRNDAGFNGAVWYGAADMMKLLNTCGAGNANPCYGLPVSRAFVNASTDFRLKAGSDLIGAGVSVSIRGFNAPWTNATDISGFARSGSFDIGAWQSGGGEVPPPLPGGRTQR